MKAAVMREPPLLCAARHEARWLVQPVGGAGRATDDHARGV